VSFAGGLEGELELDEEGDHTMTELLVGKHGLEFSKALPEVGRGQNTFSPKLKQF
jgi:hypothetical protein